jgi:hypothetical protein
VLVEGEKLAAGKVTLRLGFVQLGLAHSEEVAEESWVAGYKIGQLVERELQNLRLLLDYEIREMVQSAPQNLA